MKASHLLFLAMALPAAIAWASGERRDGNFWMNLSESGKSAYVLGFLDGAEEVHEEDDAVDMMAMEPSLKSKEGSYKLLTYVDTAAKARLATIQRLNNINVGQFTQGLNQFYSDYRNKLIAVPHAVFLVAESMKGLPADKLEEYSAHYREQDSK